MLSARIINLKTNDRHASQLGCRQVGICAGFFRGGMTSNKEKTINVCHFYFFKCELQFNSIQYTLYIVYYSDAFYCLLELIVYLEYFFQIMY